MKKIAYDQMFANELTHAWYIGTRGLMYSQLKKVVKKDAKILDFGCGTGGTIKFLIKKGYKNIYGIDSSKYAIQLCKKRGITNIKVASINEVPFKSNFFDAVICMDVLYHSGVNVQKALREVRRLLKTNGLFYSQEPAYFWLKSEHDLAIETGRRFTKKSLFQYFKKSSLQNLKISYFNSIIFVPIVILRIKDKLIKKDHYDSDVSKLPEILNRLMFLSLILETKIIKYFSLPFGLSLISIWKK